MSEFYQLVAIFVVASGVTAAVFRGVAAIISAWFSGKAELLRAQNESGQDALKRVQVIEPPPLITNGTSNRLADGLLRVMRHLTGK